MEPLSTKFSHFLCFIGILMKGYFIDHDQHLNIINCYCPYNNRRIFREGVIEEGILNLDNLILCVDLNFMMSISEV